MHSNNQKLTYHSDRLFLSTLVMVAATLMVAYSLHIQSWWMLTVNALTEGAFMVIAWQSLSALQKQSEKSTFLVACNQFNFSVWMGAGVIGAGYSIMGGVWWALVLSLLVAGVSLYRVLSARNTLRNLAH